MRNDMFQKHHLRMSEEIKAEMKAARGENQHAVESLPEWAQQIINRQQEKIAFLSSSSRPEHRSSQRIVPTEAGDWSEYDNRKLAFFIKGVALLLEQNKVPLLQAIEEIRAMAGELEFRLSVAEVEAGKELSLDEIAEQEKFLDGAE